MKESHHVCKNKDVRPGDGHGSQHARFGQCCQCYRTLNVDESYSYARVLQPGDTLQYRFTVLDDLKIKTFAMSATGTDAEADVRSIRFGFMEPLTGKFTFVQSIGSIAAGLGFLDGKSFEAGSVFKIIFKDGITNDVGLTLSFNTVAAVPLPATGLLLAPFLLVGGLAGWRRRKAALAAA